MKKKDIQTLHTKTKEELLSILKDAEAEIIALTKELRLGKSKNTNSVKMKKKDIARILTILGGKPA